MTTWCWAAGGSTRWDRCSSTWYTTGHPENVIPMQLCCEGSRAGVVRDFPSRDPSERSSFGMTAGAVYADVLLTPPLLKNTRDHAATAERARFSFRRAGRLRADVAVG